MTELAHSTPELQGVPSQAVSDFISTITQRDLELHSMVFVRHGKVIADAWWSPYQQDDVHLLYSLSKSFTSSAIGLAVAEGLLSIDDQVISFFPEKLPESLSAHTQAMQVKHLLSMASGHSEDTLDLWIEAEDWLQGFLAIAPDQRPGSVFCYNQGCTFTLAAILHRLTGQSLVDYLRPRLLDPLGITEARWQTSPNGIELGFSGLHVTTNAIAKLGQLYLQRGQWQGQQLLPAEWVDLATQRHIDSTNPDPTIRKPDWEQGYGFQFWRCRHAAYRGDGAFGQFCLVLPEQDAVLAITAGEDDMQAVLDVFWAKLLPNMQAAALQPQAEAQQQLRHQLSQLEYTPVSGHSECESAAQFYGQPFTFTQQAGHGFPGVKCLLVEPCSSGWLLTITDEKRHEINLGYETWTLGQTQFGLTRFSSSQTYKIAASAAWTSDDSFVVVLRYLETPHTLTLHLALDAEVVKLDMSWNVSFEALEAATMRGVKTR